MAAQMADWNEYEHKSSLPSSPQFIRRLSRKNKESAVRVSEISSDTDTESQETDDEEPMPERGDNHMTVKEVIEGLFSSKTVQVHHHDLILVKKYSHGKTFRQRLAYVAFKHTKTSLIIRWISLTINLISVILYLAEAIYIDVLSDSNESILINCFNNVLTNFSSDNPATAVDLFFIPKHYAMWALQTAVALWCLLGALVAVYVRQEIHGSLHKHFIRHISFSVLITLTLGLLFFFTVLYPPCFHYLWIPSFLYCWPAREHFMHIVLRNHDASFLKGSRGFRTTVMSLATIIACFVISCVCLIHHFERLGKRTNIFDTYWFTIVTFSTVGYGDISPKHWTGKLIITLFIIAALLYLPVQVDKLWRAFSLHRKHYKRYTKTPNAKHIVLVAVNLKPLVLRDFLNEIYSEQCHMDTQIVLLIDEDLPEGIKNLLGHPQWSLKVAMLRGSGLRVHDLARAKVRTADGCFLITPRTGLSATNADHQTIMSAWTIRNYAPEVKLYVHILLPESKLHLNMADHVICEGELSMSMSSLNSVFPGLATLAALLAHTFTYEGRSVHHPEYQWYERCSPGEIYHGKLGDSQYFHHFVGKNFTFASVIAYRKFHVVLIGVKPAGSELIKFNPGIHHIMNIDDTCYYISETSEVNSDYQVIQPSSFQSGLWKTTAMLGLLGMYMSGIDLGDMFHQGQHFEDVGGMDQTMKLAFPRTNSHKSLQENMSSPHPTRLLDTGSNHGNDEEDHDELMDEHMAVEMTNWHHEAQLGIQLLHYHAQGDFTHKPCVKLSVKDHHHNHHHHYYGQFGRSNSKLSPIMTPHHFHHPLNIIPEDTDVPPPDSVVVQKLSPNTRNRRFHGQMSAGPMGTSGGGNVAAPGNVFGGAPHHHHHHVDHQHKLRSHLKLMVSHGDTASITSVASSTHSTKSEKSIHSIDDIVELQLDDISEVEELEDLEEGVQHHGIEEDPLEDDHHHHHHHNGMSPCHRRDWSVRSLSPLPTDLTVGQLPTLPYCGCEPLSCHLLVSPRSQNDMKIDKSCVGDEIITQWHHDSIIAYSDKTTPSLFHFITPLRASYLPSSSLKPIIFLFGQEPDSHFLSIISNLPMIYYMVGSLTSTCDLLRAGILLAESLVILASTVHRHDERLIFASTVHRHDERLENKEVLSDADHITAVNSIAKLFPHVRLTIQVKFRYNIRFISTTPYEQSALHRLSRMVRKGDHLTYLFLPQVSSSKAYSSSMLDTLLYQSVTKPHIITLFRQLLGCHQVDGSGFIWKVLVSEELARLGTYVRMFQRLAASYSFISMAIYRSAPITPTKHDDLRDNFKEEHLEKNWKYLMGELHSLGINREVEHLKRPLHQEFIYLNPPPDFTIVEGDIVLGLRPPLTDTSSCHQSHTHKSQTLPMESETEFIPETHHPELAIPVEPVNNTNNNTTMGTDIQVKVIVTDNT